LTFLLTIEGMVAAAFVFGLVLGFLLPSRWKLIGGGLAVLAAAFAAVRLASLADHQSTEVFDIAYAALWGALGAFPGAALGSWVHRRLKRSP
jgi:uncharacterized membrane protein YfcA